MNTLYNSYFIKTSDGQQAIIDNQQERELLMVQLDSELSALCSLDDPADEVLGRLFSTPGLFDAM